jgi:hypothetical protein
MLIPLLSRINLIYFINYLTVTNITSHFYVVPSLIKSSNLTIKSIITLLYRRYSKP